MDFISDQFWYVRSVILPKLIRNIRNNSMKDGLFKTKFDQFRKLEQTKKLLVENSSLNNFLK